MKKLRIERILKNDSVIIGGDLNISVEEARGMYKATTIKHSRKEDVATIEYKDDRVTVSKENFDNLMATRAFVRAVAKAILFTSGDDISIEDLTNTINDQ